MATLSVLIITLNEAVNIEACLQSVIWADELVVIDSGSTDATCEIARRYTPNVAFHAWAGYSEQKNFGHALTNSDWVLSLDADERVTPELRTEIQSILHCGTNEQCDAYRIPIRDWMFGKFIRYGSWPHQTHVRLYRKGHGVWANTVHEGLLVTGQIGRLVSPLLHYSHVSVGRFVDKLNRYTEIEAEEMFKQGVHIGWGRTLFGTARAFLGQYVRLQGFRDGGHGLTLALLMAGYYFVTRAKLWSLWYLHEHPREG